MMYPIHCPVMFTVPATTIHLGALEQPMSEALNYFANQSNGNLFPLVNPGWSSITNFGNSGVSHQNFSDFLSSMRRIHDEASGLAARYREIESRYQSALQRDKSLTATSSASVPRRGSTYPSLAAVKPINENQRPLDEERLEEMKARHPARSPSNPNIRPRSRWYVSALSPEQGALCVNEDGRGIHFRQISSDSVVLGYGWHRSLMHYLEFDAGHVTGRSLALFSSQEVSRGDLSGLWLNGLVQSMLKFYAATGESVFDEKILITGQNVRHQAVKLQGSARDSEFLTRAFRSLSISAPFRIESEKTVAGYRDGHLSAVEAAVPLAAIAYETGDGEVCVRQSYYRSPKSSVVGEKDLPEEIRDKLRFPRLLAHRPQSRP